MDVSFDIIIKAFLSETDSIMKQVKGEMQPTISAGEAIDKLGVISALVIRMSDLCNDSILQESLLSLKIEADQFIFNHLLNLSQINSSLIEEPLEFIGKPGSGTTFYGQRMEKIQKGEILEESRGLHDSRSKR